ncbi:MAG TPA: GNAT family N-acetyltransferase [Thermomicrobiales bacterium]|nr:GNAT family N-acetyltransferase [Thermomicrobiales bacterium]
MTGAAKGTQLVGRVTIRPARPGEHVALTALVMRSAQQHWGYSTEFMAWEPQHLEIEPEHITDAVTNVLEIDGRAIGVYMLRGAPPEIELSRMMLEPSAIGSGLGRRMWEHAVCTARDLGARVIMLDSDPNAEGFYQRMGAVTVGEHDWTPPMMPDWRVKIMRFEIPDRSE